jgi:hypothetical protein
VDKNTDLAAITGQLKPNDVVLVLTTGDLGGLIPLLVEKLDSAA